MRMMIDRYRSLGHQFAKVDPLQLDSSKNLPGRLDKKILNF